MSSSVVSSGGAPIWIVLPAIACSRSSGVSVATSRLYGSGDHPVPRQRRFRSRFGERRAAVVGRGGDDVDAHSEVALPCGDGGQVLLAAARRELERGAAPSLSRSTHAAVISYQPSPGLPASQVTVGHHLRSSSSSVRRRISATSARSAAARPLRAQGAGDHRRHRRHLAGDRSPGGRSSACRCGSRPAGRGRGRAGRSPTAARWPRPGCAPPSGPPPKRADVDGDVVRAGRPALAGHDVEPFGRERVRERAATSMHASA